MRLLRRTRLPTSRRVAVSTFLLRKVFSRLASLKCDQMLTRLQLLCALDQSELPLDRRRPAPRNDQDYATRS